MDFIVVGFGLGALVMLLGIAVRDFGPRLTAARQPPPAEDALSDQPPVITLRFVSPRDWAAACRSIALAFIIGGAVIIGAAMLGIFAHMSDRNGARLVLAASLLAFGGVSLRTGVILSTVPGLDPRSRLRARLARPPKAEEKEQETPAVAAPEPAPEPAPELEPAALVVAEPPGEMATNGVVPATPTAEPGEAPSPSPSPSGLTQMLVGNKIDVSGEIQVPLPPPTETTVDAAGADAATAEESDADSTEPATPDAAPDAASSEDTQPQAPSGPGEDDEPGAAPSSAQEDVDQSPNPEVAASSRPVA